METMATAAANDVICKLVHAGTVELEKERQDPMAQILTNIGLEQLVSVFRENKVGPQEVEHLGNEEFQLLGVSAVGDRVRLKQACLNHIKVLRQRMFPQVKLRKVLQSLMSSPCLLSVHSTLKVHISLSTDHVTMYTGLVVLSQDKIIVVDKNACKVRLHSLQDGRLLAVHRTESRPRDICVCNEDETQMAVCLLSGQIEILSVKFTNKTTKITRMETLNVRTGFDGCQGMKYFNKKLVVSGWKEYNICWGVVSITDGHIETYHTICKYGKYVWSYLCTNNNDMVFISCWAGDENPDVTGVYGYRNSRREFLYQHKDLNHPRGVTMDRRHVYVCNWYPPCIHEMTESGQPLTIHTQGIQPSSGLTAIHWNQQDGLLYVTNYDSNVITRFRPEYSDHQDPVIPAEILKMDKRSLNMYKEALRDGKEKVYNIRIMIVGQYGVGKTTLTKRLLGTDVNISERKSTEGIDVHIECSKVSLSSGEWTAQEKSSEQDYRLQRLAKVLNERQSLRDRAADEETFVNSPQREKTPDGTTGITDEEHVTSPQGKGVIDTDKEAHVAVKDKDTEIIYCRSPHQGIGQNLSSTASHQEESPSAVGQRKLNQSDTFTVARSQPSENITAGSQKIDPMAELIQFLQDNADKLKQDASKNSPVSVWDFAGQYSFYTTHQTFLTRRAIYLLVSDVSGHITDLVDDECYFDSEGMMKCRVCELIEVWLNSIHSCASSPEAGDPPVILVGTHVDKISQKKLPSKVMDSETKTITSETTEFPTISTPIATGYKEHLKPSTVLGSVLKLFKLKKTKGMVESTPVFSTTGAHALHGRDQLKKERKLKPWPWKKKKKVGTDEMAAPSTVNTVGGKMVVVEAGTLQAVSSAVELVEENIVEADAQEINRHEICEKYFSEIRTYLSDKPTRFHLVNEDFAIDNTVVDSRLDDLKRKIVMVASQQSYWGEEIPTRWILLEQELMRLKAAGVKLITRSILENLNQAGAVPIATEELDLFLRFHHDIGTILYFSIEELKDKIVLDTQWMIDALKSLITAEIFVLRSAPAVADKWLVFKKSGILFPELIDAIWTKKENPDFHDNKEHILLLMEKLNIIARPRSYGEDGKIKEETFHLAPCMLRQATPKEIISPESSPQMESTSIICFMCVAKFLPPPVFHRLIGACLTQWPIAKQESENLIFCGCCVFDLDIHHRLTVYLRSYAIFAQVSRMKVTGMSLSSELCIEARNFIFENLSKIVENAGHSMEFELCVQCPNSDANRLQSLIAVSLLQKNEQVPCHSHKTSHILESKDLLKFWFEESQGTDEGNTASAVPMPLPPTGDTDRFMRLTYLLVDVGSRVLRRLLSHRTVTTTCTLDQYLAKSRNTINGLLKRKVLHQSQIDILFPPNGGNTNIEDYDVTLLSTLFNNIVHSLSQQEEGMIKCLREDRNKLYGHAKSCKMNAIEYQNCRKSISSTLITLSQQCGDPSFENEISREIQQIQVAAIPTGSYLDILKTWFSTIETVKGSLETAVVEIQGLKSRLETLESKKTAVESEGQ